MAAFPPPKADIIIVMSHLHFPATISKGGTANGVRVPPMKTFTNSTHSVADSSVRRCRTQRCAWPRIKAVTVIVAGSVIKDHSRGTSAKTVR